MADREIFGLMPLEIPTWLSSLQIQIIERDDREKNPFVELSKYYHSILQENVELNTRVHELSQALVKMKQEQWKRTQFDVNTTPENVSGNGIVSSMNDGNVPLQEHKEQTEALKKELIDVYRLKREDEETLSRLKKQCAESEQLLINKREMLDQMSKQYQQLMNDYKLAQIEISKLNSFLTVMQTENVALRQAHDNSVDEISRLKQENTRLTEKILKVKEEQMSQLDELQKEFDQIRQVRENQQQQQDQQLQQQQQQQQQPSITSIEDEKEDPENNINNLLMKSTGDLKPNSLTSTPRKDEKGRSLSQSISSTFQSLLGSKPVDRKSSTSTSTSPTTQPSINDEFVGTLESGNSYIGGASPTVVLKGPPIFNVAPPQLKSMSWIAHGDQVSCIQFDPSGSQLLSVGGDKQVKLWNSSIGLELCKFQGLQGSAVACRFSTSGQFVAAGGNDCSVHLWNVRTQRQVKMYNGHANTVTCIAFNSDSKKLISGSLDRCIRIWDTEKGACRTNLQANSSVNCLTTSPDEGWLASGHLDGCVRFFSSNGKKEMFKLDEHKPSQVNHVEFSPPDGIHVLTSGKDGRLIIWDLRKQSKKLLEITHKEYRFNGMNGGVCYSADGQYIVGGSQLKDKTEQYKLFLWRSKTGELLHCLSEHTEEITSVTWHGRGGVASCDKSGKIYTWV